MRSVVYEIARFAFWFGLLGFIVLWGFALIIPALWAAGMSAVGCIISGCVRFIEVSERVDRDVEELRNAPRFEVRDDLARVFFGGPNEGGR